MLHQNRGASAISKAIDSLYDYTEMHFQWEEASFDRIAYTNKDQHCLSHQHLLKELLLKKQTLQQGDNKAVVQFLEGINKWLLGHVHNDDKRFAEQYLKYEK